MKKKSRRKWGGMVIKNSERKNERQKERIGQKIKGNKGVTFYKNGIKQD